MPFKILNRELKFISAQLFHRAPALAVYQTYLETAIAFAFNAVVSIGILNGSLLQRLLYQQ